MLTASQDLQERIAGFAILPNQTIVDLIRWDYADAFSLNRGSAQTNVHFALQSQDFFCFLRFLKWFQTFLID